MSNGELAIIVKRTKLYFENKGDAPAGTESSFNILENSEFNRRYGHLTARSLQFAAQSMIEYWNKSQPSNWRYELMPS